MTRKSRLESLVRVVFYRIIIDGKDFASIEPKTANVPLFAAMLTAQKGG